MLEARLGRDKGAVINAFLHPWSGSLLYAFPAISLVHKVLLIAPAWARQHWFSMLLDVAVTAPWILPLRPDLISQDQGRLLHSSFSPTPDSMASAWLNPEERESSDQVQQVLLGSRAQGGCHGSSSPVSSRKPSTRAVLCFRLCSLPMYTSSPPVPYLQAGLQVWFSAHLH